MHCIIFQCQLALRGIITNSLKKNNNKEILTETGLKLVSLMIFVALLISN